MSWQTTPARTRSSRGAPRPTSASNAKQRLMKEAADLLVNPIENCNAAPLEDNIFEWHANISTPNYEGICFHFIIEFPESYPKKAPKVRPCNHIRHPNVFGSYICLDILTMSEETETTPYRGWTSAYTVSSLLVQLQCFLFDMSKNGNKYYDSKYALESVYSSALNFQCTKCGHSCATPHPPIEVANREPGFYRTRRVTLVRETASLNSPHVCDIPEGHCVLVTDFEDRRARLNLGKGKIGYCSTFTSKGVLLERICGNFGAGEYKANKSVAVLRDSKCVFKLHKDEQFTVAYIKPAGPKILARIYELPTRYRSRGIDMNNLYVDAKAIRIVEQNDAEPTKEIVLSGDSYWLHEFYGEVLDIILSMVDADTAMKVSLCHEDLRIKVENSKILVKSQYRCFYTLKTMRDDESVIGFGIKCEVMPKYSRHETFRGRNGRVMNVKRDVLQRLHPSFDYMTHEAFNIHKVKTNVWKDVVFDAFLPLFINSEHGKRALPLAEKCILNMWKKENKNNKLNCERLLETLAKLMNTTIVNMNKCVEDLEVEELQLFDSIKAIEGYMAFHHLLLAFAVKYPKLCDIASEKIKNFCTKDSVRDKEITPDIGELIVYLSISKYSWKRFYPSFAREVFDRNARWILTKYPGLRDVEGDKLRSCIRLTQSFLATKTGKRLAAFQCFFMNEIACPTELQGNPDKVKILFKEYNDRLGKPVRGIAERLQVHSRKVLAMSNWFDYFNLVGFSAPTAVQLCDWLRQSITRSACKKYHQIDKILRYSEHHVESSSYIKHKNPYNCMCAGGRIFNLKDATSLETCTLVSKPKKRVDIAFVVDCTGSMSSWLNEAKRAINKIVQDVKRKSQFKVVRFALVPYRDHAPGQGHNGYVVKKFDFTGNVVEMQKYVDFLQAGGGNGGPAAMSTAFATAAGLAWNNDAMRIMIHIGDETPHGTSDSYDYFPDGCPLGHDALRVTHNLAKKGIPIYNVFCGRSSRYGGSLTETFYNALSHITNGQCLSLSSADTLSKIVLGAALEEQTMNRISQKIGPMWDEVQERHPNARDDQIIYELYQRLKADDFKVKCIFGGKKLNKWAMKSIDTIAFCTDLKQVKAMQTNAGESLEFYSFQSEGQITDEEQTRLISEGQVRKWYKRNKEMLALAKFKKEGCQYAQPCWQAQAADERYKSNELARFGAKSLRPWAKANASRISKVFNEAGNLAKKGKSSTSLNSGSVARLPAGARNARPVGGPAQNVAPGGPRRYIPPNRRNAAPNGAPWKPATGAQNAAPLRAPQNSAPMRAPRNAAPGPRTVAPPRPTPPATVPHVSGRTVAEAPRSMSRNTSYPVNDRPATGSSSSNFPERGAPIQSMRSSRSSSNSRGAPARRSRSDSREPQNTRMTASHAPAMSRPPHASRPPVQSTPTHPSPTSQPATGVVISFDPKHIIYDYIVSKLKMTGVNAPTKISVEDGRVRVFFSSAFDADLASKSRFLYDNGAPMEVCLMENFEESKV